MDPNQFDLSKFNLNENSNYSPKDFRVSRVVRKNDSTRYKMKVDYGKYNFFVKFIVPTDDERVENPILKFPTTHIPIFEYSFKYGSNAGMGTKKLLCWIRKEVIHRVAPKYYWDITGFG